MTTQHPVIRRCPWLSELDRSETEPLSDPQRDALIEHVEQCETCRLRLERMPGTGALLEEVREAAQARAEAAVDVAAPIERLNEVLKAKGYRIEGELGRGGMGVVYKAWQVDLNRHVALKVLPALLGAVNPESMARFRREAALAASLKHSNIICVHDFGEVGGTLYYAMELVEGRSLRDLVQEMRTAGPMEAALRVVASATDQTPTPSASPRAGARAASTRAGAAAGEYFRRVAGWVADVAEALHYAHEHGVLHRDIKPANLLLSRSGRLMICDFGLARSVLTGPDARTLTLTRTLVGTSRYMSPESVDESLGPVDRRADVYALGATLYELLTLRPLFAAEDDREILHRVLNSEPARPRSIVRHVPRELEVICVKALAKRPRERYESAQALADDLRRWMLGVPILARRPSVAVRVTNFVRRRKAVAALSLALLTAVVGGTSLGVRAVVHERRAAAAEAEAKSQRVTLLRGAADVAYAERRYADALANLDAVLAEVPGDFDAERCRATAIRHLGRETEAAEILERLSSIRPDDWATHYLLVMQYRSMEEAPDGQLEFHSEQVARLMPNTSEAAYVRALNEPDARTAVALLGPAIEKEPNRLEFVLHRGQRYQQLGEYEAALRDADRAVTIAPRAAFAHAARCNALLELRRYAEALRAADRTIELEPHKAEHWGRRSLARTALGHFDAAVADAVRAIDLDSTLAPAYGARAQAYRGRGDLEAALQDVARAIALEPRNFELYLERAGIYRQLRRWEDVLADDTRVIELAPHRPIGYMNRIQALAELGRLERAVPDARRWIELQPDDPEAHRAYATVMIRLGRFEEAIPGTTTAIRLSGGTFEDVARRGQLWLIAGRGDQAIADLTRALELMPSATELFLFRAVAVASLGQRDLALEDLSSFAAAGEPAATYAALARYVVLAEAGRTEELAAALQSLEERTNDGWPGQLARFMIGQLPADGLLRAAVNDDDRAEARYYIGMKHMISGHLDEARTELAECVRLDRPAVVETVFARARLRALPATSGLQDSRSSKTDSARSEE